MKRLLALLLVSLLVLPLVACASTPKTDAPAADTSTTNTPADDAPADDTPADDTAEADQPADGEPAADDNGLVWPRLANDDVTLTLMTFLPNEISSLVTQVDHPDNIPWNEAPRRTGINLDITTLSAMAFAEQMKLALAAEEFMDIMNVSRHYAGGLDQAYEDGNFVCLSDHEDWIPNYLTWVYANDNNRKAAYTDGGHIMAFSQVTERLEPGWCGYTVRRDWLDELGMEPPETIAEWEDMLMTFKEKKTGGEAPLDLYRTALPSSNHFSGAYNVCWSGLIKVDGQLQYCFVSDGWRQYMELLHSWYDKGLIEPDFFSSNNPQHEADKERLARNVIGAAHLITSAVGSYYADMGLAPEGAYYELVGNASLEKGVPSKVTFNGDDVSCLLSPYGWMIWADGEHPDIATKFMDYFYSEEGSILTNYGIEGDTFYYDENGKPQFTDKVMHNDKGLYFFGAIHYYLINNGLTLLIDRNELSLSEEALRYKECWGQVGEYRLSAALSFTAEEASEYSAIKSDLDVKREEMFAKWVTGEVELNDDTWNTYLDEMEQIGWRRYLEIQQAAYDRWLVK